MCERVERETFGDLQNSPCVLQFVKTVACCGLKGPEYLLLSDGYTAGLNQLFTGLVTFPKFFITKVNQGVFIDLAVGWGPTYYCLIYSLIPLELPW